MMFLFFTMLVNPEQTFRSSGAARSASSNPGGVLEFSIILGVGREIERLQKGKKKQLQIRQVEITGMWEGGAAAGSRRGS
jgi:hypothetical protein